MSFPTTASTPSPVHDRHDLSFSSSQSSNPDSSTLCFESSFRLETPFQSQKAESEKHPKGKRKRTTSQDKSILEAAYNSNPKPDKAARLDIVKRVSLNEKEVQIWFQNRRQNDRRKSRPLSPQEIEALRYGNGMRVLSSDPLSTSMESITGPIALPNAAELPQGLSTDNTTTPVELEDRPSSPENAIPRLISQPSSPQVIGGLKSEAVKADFEIKTRPASTPPSSTKTAGSDGEPRPYAGISATPIGYLANRWLTGDSLPTPTTEKSGDESFRLDWDARPSMGSGADINNRRLNSFSSSTSSVADHPPPTLQPQLSSSSSQVRLSLSLDGKAEVIPTQPSPPRPTPQLLNTETLPPVFGNRTLQRSRSALSGITLPPISTLTKGLAAHFPPHLARGRSRDVHAWESCCEADTRDELTRQAENEASGSAVAAISLVRSSSNSASLSNLIHNHHPNSQPSSNSSVLQPNLSKRNTLSATRGFPDRKPKLVRAKTSPPITRYISIDKSGDVVDVEGDDDDEPEKKKRKKQGQFDMLSPSGDSDKENWSPNGDGTGRRRPLPPPEAGVSPTKAAVAVPRNPRRAILGEQDAASKRLFLNGSADARNRHANTAPPQGQRLRKPGDAAVSIFEDGENTEERRDDEDVERFMRSGVSPSKRPDMDCVAGLLSLSQGNWR